MTVKVSHREKLRMARRMQSPEEAKVERIFHKDKIRPVPGTKTPVFQGKQWNLRRKRRQEKVRKQQEEPRDAESVPKDPKDKVSD